MRPPTNPTAMHIMACSKSATILIVAPAEFNGVARRPGVLHSRWSLPWGIPCHGAFPAMGHSPRTRLSKAGLGFEDVGLGGHPASSTYVHRGIDLALPVNASL